MMVVASKICCDSFLTAWQSVLIGADLATFHSEHTQVCLACNSGAVGDEMHMLCECTALAPLRQQHADLFTPGTDTARSCFAQQDHLAVLNYIIDCKLDEHMTLLP